MQQQIEVVQAELTGKSLQELESLYEALQRQKNDIPENQQFFLISAALRRATSELLKHDIDAETTEELLAALEADTHRVNSEFTIIDREASDLRRQRLEEIFPNVLEECDDWLDTQDLDARPANDDGWSYTRRFLAGARASVVSQATQQDARAKPTQRR